MKQSPKKETANQLPAKPSTTEKGSESFGASRIAGTKPPGNCNRDMLEELGGKFQGGITNLTKTRLLAESFITSSREMGYKSIWRSTSFDATPSMVTPSINPIAAYKTKICWHNNLQPGKLGIWNSWSQKSRNGRQPVILPTPSESTAAIATWQKPRTVLKAQKNQKQLSKKIQYEWASIGLNKTNLQKKCKHISCHQANLLVMLEFP